MEARFRKGCWFRNSPLCEQFPCLFSLAVNKEAKVSDMRVREGFLWIWNWSWRRRFFVWEESIFYQFQVLLDSFLWREELDKWAWRLGESGDFTVNSMFLFLEERFAVNSGFCLLSWVFLGAGSRGLVCSVFAFLSCYGHLYLASVSVLFVGVFPGRYVYGRRFCLVPFASFCAG